MIKGQSARLLAGYIYANAGEGESTTDLVFGGHNIIAENGSILRESRRFVNRAIYSEIDINRLVGERRKNTTFQANDVPGLIRIPFYLEMEKTYLTRKFSKHPFVPYNEREKARRCEEILNIQAMGLKKRLSCSERRAQRLGLYRRAYGYNKRRKSSLHALPAS